MYLCMKAIIYVSAYLSTTASITLRSLDGSTVLLDTSRQLSRAGRVVLHASLLGLLDSFRLGTDVSVHLLPGSSQSITGQASLNVARKVLFIGGLVFALQRFHVVSDVFSENVLSVDVGVQFLLLLIVSGEAIFGVRNSQTAITGTLHGTEDTVTSGGGSETDIQEGNERRRSIRGEIVLNVVVRAINLAVTSKVTVQTQLLQQAAGTEKTSGICSSVVGQTNGHTVALQLVRVGSSQDTITGESSVHNLANNVGVGAAYNQTVLGGSVFVLVHVDQSLAGAVIGLTFASAFVFDLEALVVSGVLDDFHERLHIT